MPADGPTPIVLLLHAGELEDFRRLLEELGSALVEWRGQALRAYERGSWDVVIGGGERLLELDLGAAGGSPVRIAVLEQDSTSARDALKRARVDYVVARPVHPAALRLLLLHVLYRGPERRRAGRLSVGARVHYRTGLRRCPAVLLELSSDGCRLLAYRPPRHARQATLYLPAELGGGATFSLRGRVVRVRAPDLEDEEPGPTEFSLSFAARSAREQEHLAQLLAVRGGGPAVLQAEPGPEDPGGERRASLRRPYARRVIAVDEASARVLVGRDLSTGGMRVGPRDDLKVGTKLRIAVHVRRGEEPLVVEVRVARDDGPGGLMLRFQNLPDPVAAQLREMIDTLPGVVCRNDRGENTPILISEILSCDG